MGHPPRARTNRASSLGNEHCHSHAGRPGIGPGYRPIAGHHLDRSNHSPESAQTSDSALDHPQQQHHHHHHHSQQHEQQPYQGPATFSRSASGDQRSHSLFPIRSPGDALPYPAPGSSPSSSAVLDHRRSSVPNQGRRMSLNGTGTRPSPYDRPGPAPRSPPPSRDTVRNDALEGVGRLTLEGPSMNEDDDVEDRRKRGKTPPDMCAVCSVQDTAEWRRGPAGSRMLCNGCGLCAAKRAKERASEGFGPVSGDVEIWHELRAIGAERFKTAPENFNLPDGTMERIRATRERTEQTNAASIASSQRMQKSRKRSVSRSVSAHPEREAAAGLMGLRRASLGNEWPDRQNRSTMGLSAFVQALQRPSGPPMTPPSPPLTTRSSSTPHFSPPPMMMTPRASSDYGSRHEMLPLASHQPTEHRQLQHLPPITQMIPPQYFQGVPPPPPDTTPSPELPDLNRRLSFLEAWRQRTHGAPLPSLAQQLPPITMPSSSVRSTMTDPQPPSLEHEQPERRPAHD